MSPRANKVIVVSSSTALSSINDNSCNMEGDESDRVLRSGKRILRTPRKKRKTSSKSTIVEEPSIKSKRKDDISTNSIISNLDHDEDKNMLLLDLGELVRGRLVNRPSKQIKSPYVADVMLIDKDGKEIEEKVVQAHSPALDVGGLCVPSSIVYMTKRSGDSMKTSHIIQLVLAAGPDQDKVDRVDEGVLVGVHPLLGERVVEKVLEKGLMKDVIGYDKAKLHVNSPKKKMKIPKENTISFRRQVQHGDSRVDFEVKNSSSSESCSIIEVKNVVCSDYAANLAPEKRGPNHCVIKSDSDNYSRTGLFPWGRRSQGPKGCKVVSERAIKHVQNLSNLTKDNNKINSVLMFVVNRADCNQMRLCDEACPTFANEVRLAAKNGCNVCSFRVKWRIDGKVYFDQIMPVSLEEND